MERSDLQNGIAKSWNFLAEIGLAEHFANPASLVTADEFKDVALTENSTHAAIYLAGLNLANYNILLSDYSYLQFSWAQTNHVRYAFYPNPYASGVSDAQRGFVKKRKLVAEGDLSQEECLTLLAEASNEGRVPIIRYENAPSQHKGLAHPCSHLHIGLHGDNRWAFNRILSPLAFTMLIAKQYFPEEWQILGSDLSDGLFGNKFENALVVEKEENCRLVDNDFIFDSEKRSFIFC